MYDKKKHEEQMQEVYRSKRWKALEIHLKIIVTIGITLLWAWILVDRFESIPPGILRVLSLAILPVGIVIGRLVVSEICHNMRYKNDNRIHEDNRPKEKIINDKEKK